MAQSWDADSAHRGDFEDALACVDIALRTIDFNVYLTHSRLLFWFYGSHPWSMGKLLKRENIHPVRAAKQYRWKILARGCSYSGWRIHAAWPDYIRPGFVWE